MQDTIESFPVHPIFLNEGLNQLNGERTRNLCLLSPPNLPNLGDVYGVISCLNTQGEISVLLFWTFPMNSKWRTISPERTL